MKKDKGFMFTLFMVLAVALLMILVAVISCQPKTVMVECRDGELVPVTPEPQPEFVVIKRGYVAIGGYTYSVYKIVDKEESQICTVFKYYDGVALSCRKMLIGEITEWK